MVVLNTATTRSINDAGSKLDEIIYLDFQATTPLDPQVKEGMIPWMSGAWNPHAVEHRIGRAAAEAVEEAREKVAGLLGCRHTEIIFTSGATEASNIVLRGLTNSGDRFAISQLEHASVMATAEFLTSEGSLLHRLDVDEEGILDVGELEKCLEAQPALVSVVAVSSEIGVVQPIEHISILCADSGVPFHSDMTQAVGRIPSAIENSPVTYASISSHKIYGPQGIGALFIRDGAKKPRPLSTGGGQEKGLRSGTLPVASCVGFGIACELAKFTLERDYEHTKKLSHIMLDGLQSLDGWQVNGSIEQRIPHNLSVAFEDVDAELLLTMLPELALATGSACSAGSLKDSVTLKAIGLSDELASGTVRIGFGRTTTVEDVQTAAALLCERVRLIRGIGA